MPDQNNPNTPIDAKDSGENSSPMAKFAALPLPARVGLMIAAVVLIYGIFNRGGDDRLQQQRPNMTTKSAINKEKEVFSGIETNRSALVQSWFEQNRREISDLRDNINDQFQDRDRTLTQALEQNSTLQREMRQMLADFTAEIRSMEATSQRDKDIISQMAQEMRQIQLNSPVGGVVGGQDAVNVPKRRGRISQTPLGVSRAGVEGKSLLGGVTKKSKELLTGEDLDGDGVIGLNEKVNEPKKLPFIPPLGFVRGTLLNGLDALVGGQPTPALVRLEGKYKTAMNSTVSLNGCFMLVEFQGEISTERAIGKPARMTCVYPDQGAVTYGVSGYVVDSQDGIIGVPGVFYEGDATRLAAAMIADFAAGMAKVVESNQSTFTVNSTTGAAQQTLTGDQAKAEVAGGVNKAVGSLRDYLLQRASRVLPFVRIDTTRQIHIVLLSGTELRSQGSPWTLLFDADTDILNE